jgi:hypothetical protein
MWAGALASVPRFSELEFDRVRRRVTMGGSWVD